MIVKGIVSIFSYSFDTAKENFKNMNLDYTSLCDYNTLLEQAIESKYIQKTDLEILKKWRQNPSSWGK